MADKPEFETIRWQQEGRILTITLNRPERLNAFSAEMFRDLDQAVRLIEKCPDVRVVTITGAGRAFSSGADLNNVSRYHSEAEGDSLALGVRQALQDTLIGDVGVVIDHDHEDVRLNLGVRDELADGEALGGLDRRGKRS